jgi:hypothetical protein
LGRTKILGQCKIRDCKEAIKKREWCQPHYDQWYEKNKHLRCKWESCKKFQYDGGRRMKHGNKVLFFCRLHEVEHLRWTPEVEQTNLTRLAEKITPWESKRCWIASGPAMGRKGEYVGFIPEGAGTAEWPFHRVVWNLLMGGHRQGYELDHMPRKGDCDPACCNPAHLEPVKRGENERRKRGRRGPFVNRAAAETPAVVAFAQEHGLPLPAPKVNAPKFIG